MKTRAELEAHLQLNSTPDFVALTETLLDKSVKGPTLARYTLVSRRDRRDGRKGGGVAFFAKKEKASSVNLLEHSERQQTIVTLGSHCARTSTCGPLVQTICAW